MHTTTEFYDYQDVLQIYPDETVATEMVEHLSQVIHYYKEGDLWHKRHIKPLCRDEYECHVTFLKELRDLAENMAMEDENALIIQDQYLKLNLNYWIKFTKKYKLSEIMHTLRAIKERMIVYLNEDNILAFRMSMDIINRWEIAITEMLLERR